MQSGGLSEFYGRKSHLLIVYFMHAVVAFFFYQSVPFIELFLMIYYYVFHFLTMPCDQDII